MKILSIDVGGVRGIIPARIFQEIEDRTGKYSAELFDVVTGTSTGGLLALGLAKANQQGGSALFAKDILDVYMNRSKEIFAPPSILWKIKTGFGLWGSKYDRSAFDEILEETFGNSLLSKTVVPVFITIYSLEQEKYKPLISSTLSAQSNKINDFYLKDIAGATSAAPVLFEPKVFQSPNDTISYKGADGGLYADNPSVVGVMGAYLMQPTLALSSIELVSLGTGEYARGPGKRDNDGATGWIRKKIIGDMMDAESVMAEAAINAMLQNGNHFRFQPELPDNLISIDDCSDEHLNGLLKLAEDFIAENSQAINNLCARLTLG